ncbi:MAG: hypothetical protein KH196_12310, partial [Oscillospiraceae bacterium]|nr:hypothetical protein [Oscillospiraceae bacterium]
ITCPAARKRAPFIQDYLSDNRKVVHLFPLRSMPEAKAFLLSPALLGVVISRKHIKQKNREGRRPPSLSVFPKQRHEGASMQKSACFRFRFLAPSARKRPGKPSARRAFLAHRSSKAAGLKAAQRLAGGSF